LIKEHWARQFKQTFSVIAMAASLRKEVLLNLTKKKTVDIKKSSSSSSSFTEDEDFDNYDDYQSEAEQEDEDEEERLFALLSKSKSFTSSEAVIQSLKVIGHSLSANHVVRWPNFNNLINKPEYIRKK